MSVSDLVFIIRWWGILFLCGLLFFPFTSRLFSIMPDKGYPFAKVFGILIISYLIFLLSMGPIPFSQFWTIGIAIGSGLLFFFFDVSITKSQIQFKKTNLSFMTKVWKYLLFEELLFFLTLLFWSYIRLHQPDVYGLEKYMDVGFVNSILRSEHFPPKDMWFTPLAINYYYFGHLVTAVLTKISAIPSSITYNLMLSTIFAFCFTLSYTFITNVLHLLQKELLVKKFRTINNTFVFATGLITASLVSLGGTLHTLYIFFAPYKNDNPLPFTQLALSLQTVPNSYWYPNATRFIYNTIHEFPIYSFVVSDLHGHVVSIPIVLTIIFLLLALYVQKIFRMFHVLLISFLLATAYMTNAWDGAIYILLTVSVFATIELQQEYKKTGSKMTVFKFIKHCFSHITISVNILYYAVIAIAGFFLFSLPFSLHFKPFVGGIGMLCAPDFLISLGKVGPFLFEADHCHRSPLWQLLILHGFYYFFVLSFVIFLIKTRKLLHIDIFMLLLTGLATLLIIIPEFIYLKDIYPAHYRANTMFKLVYQSFIMLSLVSGYVIFRIAQNISSLKTIIGKISTAGFMFITLIFVSLVLSYPTFAINSFYGNLSSPKSLDGTLYLKTLHPDDYATIDWIQKNITGQPVIVEAQGDSYTDYARISTNTGLPTILGWTVHEWLWRGTYDIPAPRITEIQMLYETQNRNQAKKIIEKYNVSYVYVGDLERKKYPKLSEDKFKQLGKVVYQSGNTRIYKVTP